MIKEIHDQNFEQETNTGVNVDHDQEVASRFDVQGIPTFLIKKDGQVVDRLVGARPKPLFAAALQKVLDED
jgi:thioredoxin 1